MSESAYSMKIQGREVIVTTDRAYAHEMQGTGHVVFSHREIEGLGQATGGSQVDDDMMRAILDVKESLGGTVVDAYKKCKHSDS